VVICFLACIASHPPVLAQPGKSTPDAEIRDDLSGIWFADFITPLERPPFATDLEIPDAAVSDFVEKLLAGRPAVIDPDAAFDGMRKLTAVNGKPRTSIIVEPPDGQLPYNAAGLARVAQPPAFDGPEQRPPNERCIGGFMAPPFRPSIRVVPLQIVQTLQHLIFNLEDTDGVRIVPIGGATLASPTYNGAAAGFWDGRTLVIESEGFRENLSYREQIGRRAVHIGPGARVTERLTLISPNELLYAYQVTDASFYTRPWRGEFVLSRFNGPTFEYACHEGNFSMEGILLGGRMPAPSQ